MTDAPTHRCTRCKLDLPHSAFAPSQIKLKGAWCRACGNEHRRNKRAGIAPARVTDVCLGPDCTVDITHMRAHARYCSASCAMKVWRANNPGRHRELWYKSQYGITPEQFAALFAAQGDRCAICETGTPTGHGSWTVDHCHDTGVVRGILCQFCNQGMGMLRDDPALLRRAAAYLEQARPHAA